MCACAEKRFSILILVLPRFFYTSLVKSAFPWEKLWILIDFGQAGKALWKVFNQCQLLSIFSDLEKIDTFWAVFPNNRWPSWMLLYTHRIVGFWCSSCQKHQPYSFPVTVQFTISPFSEPFAFQQEFSGSVLFLVRLSGSWLQLPLDPSCISC